LGHIWSFNQYGNQKLTDYHKKEKHITVVVADVDVDYKKYCATFYGLTKLWF